jgi:hypothetical protein
MIGLEDQFEPQNVNYSVTQFAFSSDTLNVYRRYRPIDMSYSSIAACNYGGVLQFYTNLLQINDTNDAAIPNGLGLNPGQIANECIAAGSAYRALKSALIIPLSNSDSLYYILHISRNYDNSVPQGIIDSCCYYTVINTAEGKMTVVDKNHLLVNDLIMGQGGLAACKHANGRDWWIIVPKLFSNCFYQFLLTPKGIDSIGLQCVGDSFNTNTNRGQSCFTPDGTKFIWYTPYDSLHIIDFDRCTGELSNSRRIAVYDSFGMAVQEPFEGGVSVSPNSEYLYVTSGTELWQYNLLSDDIGRSQILIENLVSQIPLSTTETAQLAPDGKIYINPIGQDSLFHIINYPDSPGLACNFQKYGLVLPTYDWECMPIYPNYRLGPVTGSVCDTLGLDSLNNSAIRNLYNEAILKIYPNPASDYAIIDYGFTDWSKGQVTLEICNNSGQTILMQQLPMYSGYQKIDLSLFAGGTYAAYIKRNNENVAAAKFVKQ